MHKTCLSTYQNTSWWGVAYEKQLAAADIVTLKEEAPPREEMVEIDTPFPRPGEMLSKGAYAPVWYLDGKTYDFSLPVTRDITLVPKWGKEKGRMVKAARGKGRMAAVSRQPR